jgi:hypothetical protein
MISQSFKALCKSERDRYPFIEALINLSQKYDVAIIADTPEETDETLIYEGEGL